jgi:hypothetical protein
MKTKLILRTAAIIMLLHDIGHTIGASTWRNAPEPEKQEVIKLMCDKKFPFMGKERSMGEYFDGYGFACTLAMLLIVIILWLVSNAETENTKLQKKIVLAVSIILLFWGIDELLFFFPFAASFSLISSALGFYAFFRLSKPVAGAMDIFSKENRNKI